MSGRIAWAISGAGHLIHECMEMIHSYDNLDLFFSKAGEEVIRIYKVGLKNFQGNVYRDKAASAPICGSFAMGRYRLLIVAPATSNTVAKFVYGLSDNLITNIFAQGGKSRVPIIVLPTDTEPEILTMGPKEPVWVYPRKVDLENVEKLREMEFVTVVTNMEELRHAIKQHLRVPVT
jgi:flavoprotein